MNWLINQDIINLIGYVFKISDIEKEIEFKKALYLTALIFAQSNYDIKAEGLFNNAVDGLKNSHSFEEVECLVYYSSFLEKDSRRKNEALIYKNKS